MIRKISCSLFATVAFLFVMIGCGQANQGPAHLYGNSEAAGTATAKDEPTQTAASQEAPQLFFGGQAPAYVGGPFEVLGESASHPDRAEVSVGALDEADGQFAIKTHTSSVYGSVVYDNVLNLITGVITITEANPFLEVSLSPPSRGGNYFEYSKKLDEMLKVVERVRNGSNAVPHTAEPRPELNDTVRYLEFIISSLAASRHEGVYLDNPTEVKASGIYDLNVSYKVREPRKIVVEFYCDDTVLTKVSGDAPQTGFGSSAIKLKLPDVMPASCNESRFEISLFSVTLPATLEAKYNRSVKVAPSNTIERVLTHASTDLRDKACWFRVIYAATNESVLKVVLIERSGATDVLSEQKYSLSPGDNQVQDVMVDYPASYRGKLTGYEKILIQLMSKDGSLLYQYDLYAANARA